ncbi:hypothetical protein [Bhargavaea cecembensis]|uniref:hypothetical protein n=1 Tax=Bhargavaea cecembensis TaxID=394098 RepID=UPI0015CF701A|nr:hypothetical protein [Bhargavaea cecembensis]
MATKRAAVKIKKASHTAGGSRLAAMMAATGTSSAKQAGDPVTAADTATAGQAI